MCIRFNLTKSAPSLKIFKVQFIPKETFSVFIEICILTCSCNSSLILEINCRKYLNTHPNSKIKKFTYRNKLHLFKEENIWGSWDTSNILKCSLKEETSVCKFYNSLYSLEHFSNTFLVGIEQLTVRYKFNLPQRRIWQQNI